MRQPKQWHKKIHNSRNLFYGSQEDIVKVKPKLTNKMILVKYTINRNYESIIRKFKPGYYS